MFDISNTKSKIPNLYVDDFLKDEKIARGYEGFFRQVDVIALLEGILTELESKNHAPKRDNLFKVFREELKDKKVVLLGMDPYPQEGVATGRSFEVKYESWQDKRVNTSLKNILKLLYYSYYNKRLSIEEIRGELNSGRLVLPSPEELFNNWSTEGVLLLNVALSVEVGKPSSHIKLWEDFTIKLLSYLDEVNPNLIYLLWGSKANKYGKYIKNGKKISHNHPAICGNLKNPNDFLNGKSFLETKEIINWLKE